MKSLENGKSYLRFFRVRPFSSMKSVFQNERLLKELVRDTGGMEEKQKPTLVVGITTHVFDSLRYIKKVKHMVKHFLY